MSVNTKKRTDQILFGVLLIGLGALWIIGDLFPGILLVIGAALIARNVAEGKHWSSDRAPLVLIGLWLFFWLPMSGLLFPLLLIGFGMVLLFSRRSHAAT